MLMYCRIKDASKSDDDCLDSCLSGFRYLWSGTGIRNQLFPFYKSDGTLTKARGRFCFHSEDRIESAQWGINLYLLWTQTVPNNDRWPACLWNKTWHKRWIKSWEIHQYHKPDSILILTLFKKLPIWKVLTIEHACVANIQAFCCN